VAPPLGVSTHRVVSGLSNRRRVGSSNIRIRSAARVWLARVRSSRLEMRRARDQIRGTACAASMRKSRCWTGSPGTNRADTRNPALVLIGLFWAKYAAGSSRLSPLPESPTGRPVSINGSQCGPPRPGGPCWMPITPKTGSYSMRFTHGEVRASSGLWSALEGRWGLPAVCSRKDEARLLQGCQRKGDYPVRVRPFGYEFRR